MASDKSGKSSDDLSTVAYWSHRARGIGLLLGFAITFWISWRESLPLADATLRAVVGALAMSLVCWWCALLVLQGVMRGAAARSNAEVAAAQASPEETPPRAGEQTG